MKIKLFTIVGCAVSGAAVIVYAILDYQNRVYEYRYLPSKCEIGSSCPFPAVNDELIWLGVALLLCASLIFLVKWKLARHIK